MLKPEIGNIAGQIWKILGQKGPTTIETLPSWVQANSQIVVLGLGWLARENKIVFAKITVNKYSVSLTETELHNYQQKVQKAGATDKK